MNEKNVYLAKIVCECPECDKLFTVERYVEQFKPIREEDCRILCFSCAMKNRYHKS